MPSYIFLCDKCGKHYEEGSEAIVAEKDGKLKCGCGETLSIYDTEKTEGSTIQIVLYGEGDRNIVLNETMFVPLPYSPITEKTFDKLKKYCQKVLKLYSLEDV